MNAIALPLTVADIVAIELGNMLGLRIAAAAARRCLTISDVLASAA